MKYAITIKPPRTPGAKALDPDNPPWSEETLGLPVAHCDRGPQKAPTKVLTTIRLDADVLAFFDLKDEAAKSASMKGCAE